MTARRRLWALAAPLGAAGLLIGGLATNVVADEEAGGGAAIRLDPAQRQAIGLTFGVAERRAVEKSIHTVGRLDYDERRIGEVTVKVDGWIHELFVDSTGKAVRKGDPLFSLYSPELATAEEEYLLALRTEARLRGSPVPGAAEGAAELVRASRERLRLWDLTDRQIRDLEESGRPTLYRVFHSPLSGVVIEKNVLVGSHVQAGATLYKIADLSTLWVYADVYEHEAPLVQVGQEATISLPYVPDETFTARVDFVYPVLDPKTRTVRVRLVLPNRGRTPLRPEMYGNVELRIPLGERLVVPATAVLDSGRRARVFVDRGEGRLEPREVRPGLRLDDAVEILAGLAPGERVVTSANFLVDSESRLQAAESMMAMMGAIGMGDWKMESAKPMTMGAGAPASTESPPEVETGGPVERILGELRVEVSPAKGPARTGFTAIRIRVRDARGEAVTGARVRFTYTMDMPGMAIEEATAREVDRGVYEGIANFTMPGPWGLVVEVSRSGGEPVRGKFTIRVGR
jgi:Cu(I)/Ag(I) efflux system membrane fusion protein